MRSAAIRAIILSSSTTTWSPFSPVPATARRSQHNQQRSDQQLLGRQRTAEKVLCRVRMWGPAKIEVLGRNGRGEGPHG